MTVVGWRWPVGEKPKTVFFFCCFLKFLVIGLRLKGFFFFTATFSNVKLKLTVPGVPNSYCNSVYQSRNRISINSNQLCAGGGAGKDSCQGDSGGAVKNANFTKKKNHNKNLRISCL